MRKRTGVLALTATAAAGAAVAIAIATMPTASAATRSPAITGIDGCADTLPPYTEYVDRNGAATVEDIRLVNYDNIICYYEGVEYYSSASGKAPTGILRPVVKDRLI